MNPDGTNTQAAFEILFNTTILPYVSVVDGSFDAFQPACPSDGKWIASGWVSNSSVLNSEFPSFSPDNDLLVCRELGLNQPLGLRILNLTNKSVKALTWGWDNNPAWSPDGLLILFTRRTSLPNDNVYEDNYRVCTIKPDGSHYKVLTASGANDAHAVWTNDGKILYSTGEFGFQDEASLFDNQLQPYAQIMSMESDGSNKQILTNRLCEDAKPLYVPSADSP